MTNLRNLNRSIWVNMTDVLTSSNFVISVLLLFGVLFAEVTEEALHLPWRQYDPSGFGDAYFFNISMHFGYYIYAAPLACAFASSGLFCNDAEAGFYRLRLMKSGRREYKYGLFFGSTIGGGLALMLGVILFAALCSMIYRPYLHASEMAAMDAWLPVLNSLTGNWNYMVVNAFLAFVFGMVWSGVGLTFSILSPNRYVSYLAPFIICFCAVLILPIGLHPLEMLVQMNWESFTFPKLFAYQTILYLGTLTLFSYAFERRIIHGQD